MYTKRTTVVNKTGIHARPAGGFVKLAKQYAGCAITVANLNRPEEKPANAKSVISVLALGMVIGTEIEISAEGENEEQAVNDLVAFVESGCGE